MLKPDPAVGNLRGVEVGYVVYVLEEYAASIIRVKLNRRSELSCYKLAAQQTHGEGLGVCCGPVGYAERKFDQNLF
jgi:hypothetical protein